VIPVSCPQWSQTAIFLVSFRVGVSDNKFIDRIPHRNVTGVTVVASAVKVDALFPVEGDAQFMRDITVVTCTVVITDGLPAVVTRDQDDKLLGD
jgi:hypothetical protein